MGTSQFWTYLLSKDWQVLATTRDREAITYSDTVGLPVGDFGKYAVELGLGKALKNLESVDRRPRPSVACPARRLQSSAKD